MLVVDTRGTILLVQLQVNQITSQFMFAKTHNWDWDDLRYFLAVAEQGTLSGAARTLAVNHSTVFRRINQFEDSLGVRLFERLPDGYRLTQPGEELKEHAQRIRDEVDALSLRVAGKDFQPSGVVRITAPDGLVYNFLSVYLKSFCKRYTAINVELNVSNEDLNLSRREADIAVRATSNPPVHLVGRKVCSLPWSFYASKNYLKAKGTPKSLEDLSHHEIIGPDGVIANLKAFQELEKRVSPTYRLRASNLVAIAALAKVGNGVALLPDDQISAGMVRLFELEPRVTSEIWLLTHPELRTTERVRLLMNHILESFRNDKRLRRLAIFDP